MKKLGILLLLASASLLSATAVPANGTLTAPVAGGSSSVTWSGGPLTGSYVGTVATVCSTLWCDSFDVNITVPASFYTANPSYAIHAVINWDSNVQDLDLYVYSLNADGTTGDLWCSSTQGSTNFEDANCGVLPAGNYRVRVRAWIGANTTYTGRVTLAPEPQISASRARYKPGNFTFSSPLVLTRPAGTVNTSPIGPIFYEQDAEPRVVHDSVGNIYAAAIQAVPAGTDMWKSMDGGATFSYAGQPDGAQAQAAAINGVGIGGGDEDVVVGPNGQLALSSLWLGGVTNCASNDGATTWLCNPMASDVPEDDRQWLAWYGPNIVYLTTKNLGTLTAGTESVYVVKSFDGGKTFPQITDVTKPLLGVQPGDEGNIVVDQNNGNVYLVFFGADTSQLYMAKSTDGGQNFVLKLVYQAPSNVSLQHVFPAIAVDRGSGLHIVFSDGRTSFLTSSADQGVTWSQPLRLNNTPDSKTSVEPWVVAGDYGKVNVFFYGTASLNFLDPNADWTIFMAQSLNAFARNPLITQSAAVPYVMHHGAICVNGTGCPNGTRNLLEYFFPDVYLDGGALAVYPDDKNNLDPNTTITRSWFIRQTGGSKVTGK